jgi:hypothetical protein
MLLAMSFVEFGFEGVEDFVEGGLDRILATLSMKDAFALLNINEAGDHFPGAVVGVMPKANRHRIRLMHQFLELRQLLINQLLIRLSYRYMIR